MYSRERLLSDENVSVCLMALSESGCLKEEGKEDIWILGREMNIACVIFSVHWAETLSVMTQLLARVQITEIQLFSHFGSRVINISAKIKSRLCFQSDDSV